MQTQSETDMDVESGADRNVSKEQQDASTCTTVPNRMPSEQLPVMTNQQSRCFIEDQTSATHNECYIQPHLQNASEPLKKSAGSKIMISSYNIIYSVPSTHRRKGLLLT